MSSQQQVERTRDGLSDERRETLERLMDDNNEVIARASEMVLQSMEESN